jgi:hypothetical protein
MIKQKKRTLYFRKHVVTEEEFHGNVTNSYAHKGQTISNVYNDVLVSTE